ncbi:MAG: helix-turn-helix domain-containing protein [Polyangiaceae bacterium]|nr:helix-turn-helix domain-containing protein [Polyangiaceae bacterium]
MPRRPASSRGPRPAQGAHLLALRTAAGLTQVELAALLGVHQGNIAFWEWAEKPPRGEVLPKMAKAFGVRVDDLLVDAEAPRPRRSGPVGRLQRVFEEAASSRAPSKTSSSSSSPLSLISTRRPADPLGATLVPMTAREILQAALALPPDERARLIDELEASLPLRG